MIVYGSARRGLRIEKEDKFEVDGDTDGKLKKTKPY